MAFLAAVIAAVRLTVSLLSLEYCSATGEVISKVQSVLRFRHPLASFLVDFVITVVLSVLIDVVSCHDRYENSLEAWVCLCAGGQAKEASTVNGSTLL